MSRGWILTNGAHLPPTQAEPQPLNAVNPLVPGRTEPKTVQTLWTTKGNEHFEYACLDFMDTYQIKRKKLTKNMHLYSNKVISELQVSIYISQKQTYENVSCLNLKRQ